MESGEIQEIIISHKIKDIYSFLAYVISNEFIVFKKNEKDSIIYIEILIFIIELFQEFINSLKIIGTESIVYLGIHYTESMIYSGILYIDSKIY